MRDKFRGPVGGQFKHEDLVRRVPAELLVPADAVQEMRKATQARALGSGLIGKPDISDALRALDEFSLAEYQTPLQRQHDRALCWAFAGAAALEAAYKRKYGTTIKVSEEYLIHTGRTGLGVDMATGYASDPETGTSLIGFQGHCDIVEKMFEWAAPPAFDWAPYPKQGDLVKILNQLGIPSAADANTQEEYDALEFCEQHIPLLARVNARYRVAEFKYLVDPTPEDIEDTLLAGHEVVVDVDVAGGGGHNFLIIGFNRKQRYYIVKNSWTDTDYIHVAYENDPTFTVTMGAYIIDVVDPTYVQSEACWLGNWQVTVGDARFRMILRRGHLYQAGGKPTKLGTAYLADGPHDVNGELSNNGTHLTAYIAPTTAKVKPGTFTGTRIDADLDWSNLHNPVGKSGVEHVSMTRWTPRFAAIFTRNDGTPWAARHGLSAEEHQRTFEALVADGYCPTDVSGYSDGREARFNTIWKKRPGPPFELRHHLTGPEVDQKTSDLTRSQMRLVRLSGYEVDGQERFAALWEQSPGPTQAWRHGLTGAEFQQALGDLSAQGFLPVSACGYRTVNGARFAAIWERSDVEYELRFGLTGSEYQAKFDEQVALGRTPVSVSGYSDLGIAKYVAIWRKVDIGEWHARHGIDGPTYQKHFEELAGADFQPHRVVGYGDAFYPS